MSQTGCLFILQAIRVCMAICLNLNGDQTIDGCLENHHCLV